MLPNKINKALRIYPDSGTGALARYSVHYVTGRRTGNIEENDLVYDVLCARHTAGTMVDVGAHFGGTVAPFVASGWRVLAFEPDSANRRKLEEQFGRSSNITIDRRAIADFPRKNVPFFRSAISTGISGLSSFDKSHVAAGEVETTTLALALKETGIGAVDYLKIDTEGYDLFVLRSHPWHLITPRMILCEFEDKKTVPLGYTFHDLAQYLQSKGYVVIVSEWFPIKRYGTPGEWRRFGRYPCKLKNRRAWGNLIAGLQGCGYYRTTPGVCAISIIGYFSLLRGHLVCSECRTTAEQPSTAFKPGRARNSDGPEFHLWSPPNRVSNVRFSPLGTGIRL
jgi:FkbM family methyltransferase